MSGRGWPLALHSKEYGTPALMVVAAPGFVVKTGSSIADQLQQWHVYSDVNQRKKASTTITEFQSKSVFRSLPTPKAVAG